MCSVQRSSDNEIAASNHMQRALLQLLSNTELLADVSAYHMRRSG
jgi:hypothetical protein